MAAAGLWSLDDCSVLHRVKLTRRYNLEFTDSPATSTHHRQLALGEVYSLGMVRALVLCMSIINIYFILLLVASFDDVPCQWNA